MRMRVLIVGIDGYLGWPLAQHLAERGHEVGGLDAFLRREWVDEVGGTSAIPISDFVDRRGRFRERWGKEMFFREANLVDWEVTSETIQTFQPDALVHLGECPSAPFSMIDVHHCNLVHTNNVIGTLNILHALRDFAPDCHLIKLGTMGEYGTPKMPIPEGFAEFEYRGYRDHLPFPRQAGSWYHWSKVHDSNNVMFACRVWGLRSTDIMQGVVYGTRIDAMGEDPRSWTRLDFDQCFGTAINRFCCQTLIGEPMTLFGRGYQKRGFLPLRDSIQCMTLVVENPPEPGHYRVFNQFEEAYTIAELAERVRRVAIRLGLTPKIRHIENPRIEAEEHFYEPEHQGLLDLGYQPTRDMESEIATMLRDLEPNVDRVMSFKNTLVPDIRWRGGRDRCSFVD
jgi:UDP-sulfoquinovose synthase